LAIEGEDEESVADVGYTRNHFLFLDLFLELSIRWVSAAVARFRRHPAPFAAHQFLLDFCCAGVAHASEQYFWERLFAKKYGAGQSGF
jgi:hypothetical protein